MKGHPTSYKDPLYAALDKQVSEQLGLPSGLLPSIRTRGERSNADQVSEAGAKTVYQITDTTRDLIQKKYGVDAYSSPKNAAMAAGLLLKEGLDRNKGNAALATAEYHGGTSKENWGKRTKDYVKRVTGQPLGGTGGSTFDRVMAQRQATQPPQSSAKGIYDAYASGRMTPEEAAQFEADVSSGAFMLPRGGKLKKLPAAPVLPQGVIDAANAPDSPMTADELRQLHDDVQNGVVSLPKGQKLNPFRERTFLQEAGRQIGLGTRAALQGIGSGMGMLTDAVTAPFQAVLDIAGFPGQARTSREIFEQGATGLGLPQPVTSSERIASAGVEAGASALPLMAAGAPLTAGGKGATAAIGTALTEFPVAQVTGSVASGAAGELAAQKGAGPVGQTAAALLAGVPVGMGAAIVERAISAGRQVSPKATAVIAQTPKAVLVDQAGELTEDGAELALRYGIEPNDLKQIATRQTVPDQAVAQAIPEQVPAQTIPERAAAPAYATPEAPAAIAVSAVDETLPQTAVQRVEEAAAERIPLSRGQATQQFDIQDAEATLRAQASGEGEQARQFFQAQNQAIQDAADTLRNSVGGSQADMNLTDRGSVVKEAVRELRDLGKKGVSALYKVASDLGGENTNIETDGIIDAARKALVEADVPDQVKNVIKQEMARYGLVKGKASVDQFGLTTIKLPDGGKVQFYGDVTPLTLGNAEEFRQIIGKQYEVDGPRKLSQQIKMAVDDAVENTIEKGAKSGGDIGAAYKKARAASRQYKQTFAAKDVIQQIADLKKGVETDALSPEAVMRTVLGTGKESLTNLRKMKAILLSNPTPKSKAAWEAIKATAIGDILDNAYTVNTNLGGGNFGSISGAKLNSAINKFGIEKLKILFDENEFNRLMRFRRVVGNATIPIRDTTNPSGSAFKIMRFLGPAVNKVIPFGNQIGEAVGAIASKIKEVSQAQETLKGITTFDATKAATAEAADVAANGVISDLIDAARRNTLLAPVLASVPKAETDTQTETVTQEEPR